MGSFFESKSNLGSVSVWIYVESRREGVNMRDKSKFGGRSSFCVVGVPLNLLVRSMSWSRSLAPGNFIFSSSYLHFPLLSLCLVHYQFILLLHLACFHTCKLHNFPFFIYRIGEINKKKSQSEPNHFIALFVECERVRGNHREIDSD